ncbi:hypothetical protein SDC9_105915 [bioreactor metagenome]|uniref:Uncharacterized protein n=1 Tax=bioreactor metagenome TaxID=1076179 RepID=A0A645B0X1_9ZZZZ
MISLENIKIKISQYMIMPNSYMKIKDIEKMEYLNQILINIKQMHFKKLDIVLL